MATSKHIEYMCSYCGMKITHSSLSGKPAPGACYKRGKTNDGRTKPHSWIINRKW